MSSATVRPRVVLVDGVPMSGLLAEAPQPRAVVVAFHGGASTAAYFDCPGHPRLSLLRAGAALGFTVVALDRPGYGASAPYPDAMHRPEQRVALAYGTVDKILGSGARGAGLFILAHSAGCELAVRMAVDERAADAGVLGLELAGTGLQYDADASELLKTATPTQRPAGLRELLWQPAHLYPAEVLTGITNSSAEHERVWRSDPDAMAQIAAMFTAAPRFVINEQASAGHNLSLSVSAAAYHLKVLSFVEDCVVARQSATTKLEAG